MNRLQIINKNEISIFVAYLYTMQYYTFIQIVVLAESIKEFRCFYYMIQYIEEIVKHKLSFIIIKQPQGDKMVREFITVNLEQGMPTVDVALRRLSGELATSRAHRVQVVKFIHGYGSTGTGGKLRVAIQQELERLKKKGAIKLWLSGENWEIFNRDAIVFLDSCNELRSDRDLGRHNNGISMVLLK